MIKPFPPSAAINVETSHLFLHEIQHGWNGSMKRSKLVEEQSQNFYGAFFLSDFHVI